MTSIVYLCLTCEAGILFYANNRRVLQVADYGLQALFRIDWLADNTEFRQAFALKAGVINNRREDLVTRTVTEPGSSDFANIIGSTGIEIIADFTRQRSMGAFACDGMAGIGGTDVTVGTFALPTGTVSRLTVLALGTRIVVITESRLPEFFDLFHRIDVTTARLGIAKAAETWIQRCLADNRSGRVPNTLILHAGKSGSALIGVNQELAVFRYLALASIIPATGTTFTFLALVTHRTRIII